VWADVDGVAALAEVVVVVDLVVVVVLVLPLAAELLAVLEVLEVLGVVALVALVAPDVAGAAEAVSAVVVTSSAWPPLTASAPAATTMPRALPAPTRRRARRAGCDRLRLGPVGEVEGIGEGMVRWSGRCLRRTLGGSWSLR
jgi:hypothetical protein